MSSDPASISRRSFVAGSAAVLAGLSLSGCGFKKETSTGADDIVMNYFITNPPAIDPYNIQDVTGAIVGRQLFDTLMYYDFHKNELVGLAADPDNPYDENEDATEFTFHVLKGRTFHNGEPVTAHSFKRAWERVCNPKTGDSPSVVSYYFDCVSGYDDMINNKANELVGVTCLDDYTLKVKLSKPYADFPYITSLLPSAPVPQVALDDFKKYFIAPIGNGSFRMNGSWEDGQYINISRYEGYKGKKPSLAGINFGIQKDVETGYQEFKAGNYDICEVPRAIIKDCGIEYGLAKDGYTITPHHQLALGDEPSIYYLVFNMNDKTLKDPDIRHAMSLAVNRQSICDTLFAGTREPADNVVPTTIKGYKKGIWPYARFDRDQANAILDRKYPRGKNGMRDIDVELMYNLDGDHKDTMMACISDFNAIGINVTSKTGEWVSISSDMNAGNFEMGRGGWVASFPAIDNFLYPLFYTGTGDNSGRYSNHEVDRLLDEARSIVDDQARIDKYNQANAIIGEDCPIIPLMSYKHDYVGSARCEMVYLNPMVDSRANEWKLS